MFTLAKCIRIETSLAKLAWGEQEEEEEEGVRKSDHDQTLYEGVEGSDFSWKGTAREFMDKVISGSGNAIDFKENSIKEKGDRKIYEIHLCSNDLDREG